MTGRYAEGTPVPVGKSRDELYRTLARYGATETLLHETATGLRVGFILGGMRIAFPFELPNRESFDTTAKYEKELRRRWRVLILVLKGRFESIENEAETAETAFLPYLMLPDGSTVADEAIPRVQEAYRSGRMPDTLLPSLPRVTGRVIELPSGN